MTLFNLSQVLLVELAPIDAGGPAANATVDEATLMRALIVANATAPTYSVIRRSRTLLLPPGSLPLSAKGSVLRHVAEQTHAEAMDEMDAATLGASNAREQTLTADAAEAGMARPKGVPVELDVADSLANASLREESFSGEVTRRSD